MAGNELNSTASNNHANYGSGVEVEKEVIEEGTGSLFSGIINLTNTIVGAGVLGLPFAFNSSGLGLGMLLLSAVGIVETYSLILLLESSKVTGIDSYGGVAKAAYGVVMDYIVQFNIMLQCFGVCVAYTVIIGDLVPSVMLYCVGNLLDFATYWDVALLIDVFEGMMHLLTADAWIVRTMTMIIISFLVIFPLVCLRKMDSLRFTSVIAIFSIFYVCLLVVVWATLLALDLLFDTSLLGTSEDNAQRDERRVELFKTSSSVALTIPIFTLAYTCHMNMHPIYRELRNPTRLRAYTVVSVSTITCTLIYAVVGICGYFVYLQETQGNILLNFPQSNIFIQIARVGVTLTVTFSFPVLAYPLRLSFDRIFFASWMKPEMLERHPWSLIRFIIEGFFIVLGALVLGILLPKVENVFDVVGASCSTLVSMVFPQLIFFRLCPGEWYRFHKLVALFVGCMGTFLAVVTTSITLLEIVGVLEK